MNILVKSLVGLVLVAGIITAVAPAAEAGTACKVFLKCSKVTNHKDSQRNLLVARDWGNTKPQAKSPTAYLKPGKTNPWRDTDAFKTDWKCRTYIQRTSGTPYAPKYTWSLLGYGKWYKVTDPQHAIVKVNC